MKPDDEKRQTITTAGAHGFDMGDTIEINYGDGRPPKRLRIASSSTGSTMRVRPKRWYDRVALWIWRHARWLAK